MKSSDNRKGKGMIKRNMWPFPHNEYTLDMMEEYIDECRLTQERVDLELAMHRLNSLDTLITHEEVKH